MRKLKWGENKNKRKLSKKTTLQNLNAHFSILLIVLALALFFIPSVNAARLPIINSDTNAWGSVLNQWLSTEHTENGTHRNVTINGTLNIQGEGSTTFFVNSSSGNVGIGATSPVSTLEVEHSLAGWTDVLTIDNPSISNGVGVKACIKWINGGNIGGYICNDRDANNFTISNPNTASIAAMNFQTSNKTRMMIDVNGNVGIGTTSPNTKLTVIGGINASGGLNVTAGDVLLATTSGNVGIGTASPNAKLHVVDNINAPNLRVDNSNTWGPMISLNATEAAGKQWWITSVGSAGGSRFGHFEIQDRQSKIENTFTIENGTGNVGIGQMFPNVTLGVSGAANITGYLEVGKGLNVSNGMNVLSGNVGIGTTTPKTKLSIQNGSAISTIGSAGLLTLVGQTGGSSVGNLGEIYFKTWDSSTNPQGVIGIVTTGTASQERGALYFATKNADGDSAPTEVMRITDTGNVGINTTSPKSPLHLIGGFNLTSGSNRVYNNVTCTIIEGATSSLAIC